MKVPLHFAVLLEIEQFICPYPFRNTSHKTNLDVIFLCKPQNMLTFNRAQLHQCFIGFGRAMFLIDWKM